MAAGNLRAIVYRVGQTGFAVWLQRGHGFKPEGERFGWLGDFTNKAAAAKVQRAYNRSAAGEAK